jgi:hypothetical protein
MREPVHNSRVLKTAGKEGPGEFAGAFFMHVHMKIDPYREE